MKVKIKKVSSNAIIPSYANEGDAGLDLTATSILKISNYLEYGTGLSIEIPEGYVGLIFPRSSISKTQLILANSVGVIDSGYRGEIKIRFKHASNDYNNELLHIYKVGDKVAQLIILPVPYITFVEAEELSDTSRGEGGFGSTGK
jgi:dUTP pyrophosphatase